MNAANEVAVQAFLEQAISFAQIPEVIRQTMKMHTNVKTPDLSAILGADKWARKQATLTLEEQT